MPGVHGRHPDRRLPVGVELVSAAEELREAARLMRERAEAAAESSPAPWVVDSEVASRLPAPYGVVFLDDEGSPISVVESYSWAEVTHVASWHPAVALAVANWLEEEAGSEEEARRTALPGLEGFLDAFPDMDAALAVARAYLGSEVTA